MTYIPRYFERYLIDFIDKNIENKNILLVEGARQVGKTTVVTQCLKKIKKRVVHQLNLEKDALIRAQIDNTQEFQEFEDLLRDKLGFEPNKNHILFIDEAQESINLGRYVRFMKESWSQATVILSGSSLSRLFRSDVRYPVGRVIQKSVHPFSFSEFLVAMDQEHLSSLVQDGKEVISQSRHEHLLTMLDQYLEVGGLPESILKHANKENYKEKTKEIIANFEQDFIRLFDEQDIHIVKSCFQSVANFVGAPSKNTSVIPSPTAKVNDKIKEVFARLEDWKFFLLAPQNGVTVEKKQSYLPKRYMFDTGILRYLREQGTPSISVLKTINPMARRAFGGIIENQVAIDLSRQEVDLVGWKRSSSGGEIDFVYKNKDLIIPIECKSALKIKTSHLRGLINYLEMYDLNIGVVVSLAPYQRMSLKNKITIINIPLYMIEALPNIVKQKNN